MTAYEDKAVPFQLHGNKHVLTLKQFAEQPWLREFVEKFSGCFEIDEGMAWLVFTPPENQT